MDWKYITDLLKGVFWSFNSITTWLGIVSFIFLFFPKLEWKMKDRLAKIRPYAIHILWGCILISVITTSYSMRKNNFATQNLKTDTKQDIRNFFESINPMILQIVDTRQKKFPILIGVVKEAKLSELSERPDFNKFLKYEQMEWTMFGARHPDANKVLENGAVVELNQHGTLQGYFLYPKDALVK